MVYQNHYGVLLCLSDFTKISSQRNDIIVIRVISFIHFFFTNNFNYMMHIFNKFNIKLNILCKTKNIHIPFYNTKYQV